MTSWSWRTSASSLIQKATSPGPFSVQISLVPLFLKLTLCRIIWNPGSPPAFFNKMLHPTQNATRGFFSPESITKSHECERWYKENGFSSRYSTGMVFFPRFQHHWCAVERTMKCLYSLQVTVVFIWGQGSPPQGCGLVGRFSRPTQEDPQIS